MQTRVTDGAAPAGAGLVTAELPLKNRALDAAAEGITITDARLPDNPLIYVNEGFERLTGYSAAEVLGRNCRFLQGPSTDLAAADEIRRSVREKRPSVVELLNHRKDGTPFWNRLSITPVRDGTGTVTHFIGVQSDVTDRRNAEEALRRTNHELEIATRRMRKSLTAAARIQRSLLPGELPNLPGLRFAFGYRPCDELAGDALNVIRLDEGRIGFYVLDVSGHGVPAALLSVTLSRFLSPAFEGSCLLSPDPANPLRRTVTPPARVAELLNQQFSMSDEGAQYFTMIYGVLDVRSFELRLVAAGHPPPLLSRAGGAADIVDCSGLPIGVLDGASYDETVIRLAPGDRLVLYSDGVTEAQNPEGGEFGVSRLQDALAGTAPMELDEAVDAVMRHIDAWCGPAGVRDDVSLLAIETRP
jgi:phosphoserine phosphatase RsbU/P